MDEASREEGPAPRSDRGDFAGLRKRVAAAGCFTCRPWQSVVSLVLHVAVSAALYDLSARAPVWAMPPLFVLACLVFYRIGFLMHDAAHGAVYADGLRNRAFAAVCAGVLGEFPSGWRQLHNQHHRAPNVIGRDRDQTGRWDPALRFEHPLVAAVAVLLFARFRGVYVPRSTMLVWLRDCVITWRTSRETFAQELVTSVSSLGAQLGLLTLLFGVWGPLAFFLHTWIGMVYLNLVFVGNHYDMPTFEAEEATKLDYATLQIRSTRNYAPGWLAMLLFGGVEYHIEHHLFPNMPR